MEAENVDVGRVNLADVAIADVATADVTQNDSDAAAAIEQAARAARSAYEKEYGLHEDYARAVASILENCASEGALTPHSITHRAKTPDSFEKKAARVSSENPSQARYSDPFQQITDKAGVRVITYFLETVEVFDTVIYEQFDVLEKLNKSGTDPDRLGYQSVHYLVRLGNERVGWPEYRRFKDLIVEIQVRTILQHAWAEIEHDLRYKAIAALPTRVQRRFAALAGLIEIADREFQAIADEDSSLRDEARKNVDVGRLDKVEVTGDSIHAYLDRKYGPDGRMSEWSYSWEAKALRQLGFENLAEVDECISAYDDSRISRAIYGARQGQITRFEDVLAAAMGRKLIPAHPYYTPTLGVHWLVVSVARKLGKLREAGITIGDYEPPNYPNVGLAAHELAAFEAILNGERP